MKILVILIFTSFCHTLLAALPPDARGYLDKIPEKRLSLPFVIQAALLNAKAYQVAGLNYASAELEEIGVSDAKTDTLFFGSAGYIDDNSAKTGPFQPLRAKQWNWDLGLSKNWGTGTQTTLRWLQEDNDLEFGNLGTFGNTFITQYKQSAAEISLEQDLLKDSFGYAHRSRRRAAQARGASLQWQTRNEIEDITFTFINRYYSAWLLQQNVVSLEEQVKRQKKQVRILRRRAKKGAIERPDLIQIETLLATTSTNLSAVKNQLAHVWDQLVIGLAFPRSFLGVDPMEVPTTIDNPVPLALRVCGQKEPVKTAKIFALEKRLEGLDGDFKASKNESLPDLKLVAGYRGNSIDDRAAVNFQNVLDGEDRNGFGLGPAWNVGLKLSFPLSNSAAKAKRSQAYIEKEKAAAYLEIEVDDLKTNWRDTCRKLQVEWDNEKIYNNIVLEQKKRVDADENRFRLGRIRVNQWVDAENDLTSWTFRSHQKKVEVRALAWKVQQYSGEMYRFLSPHLKELLDRGKM